MTPQGLVAEAGGNRTLLRVPNQAKASYLIQKGQRNSPWRIGRNWTSWAEERDRMGTPRAIQRARCPQCSLPAKRRAPTDAGVATPMPSRKTMVEEGRDDRRRLAVGWLLPERPSRRNVRSTCSPVAHA